MVVWWMNCTTCPNLLVIDLSPWQGRSFLLGEFSTCWNFFPFAEEENHILRFGGIHSSASWFRFTGSWFPKFQKMYFDHIIFKTWIQTKCPDPSPQEHSGLPAKPLGFGGIVADLVEVYRVLIPSSKRNWSGSDPQKNLIQTSDKKLKIFSIGNFYSDPVQILIGSEISEDVF